MLVLFYLSPSAKARILGEYDYLVPAHSEISSSLARAESIVLSFLLFGLTAGATTSTIAFLAILGRSDDVIGSSMKGLAELSTILEMALGLMLLRKSAKLRKPFMSGKLFLQNFMW